MFSNRTAEDMLEKAKRELEKYQRGHSDDDLFNLFVSIAHIEDYFLQRPSRKTKKLRTKMCEEYFGSDLYSWMKFVSNKQKHAKIERNVTAIEMDQTLRERVGSGCVGGAMLNEHVVNGTPAHEISCSLGAYKLDVLARMLISKWGELLAR
ncbi:hypothetical protein [Halodesulfovibrio sp.]|jgi:hypothetical protein|uniref:hypothetical protein n=1 Tax=Halodesulfovibrio sp. TaxID=1912772 RepID=UPI0025CF4C27|nr:hypothetical protein [Halodesulfovibrio sp.]MCT4627725.1 hypothetical protein [Halodesulfovibrio sp.]